VEKLSRAQAPSASLAPHGPAAPTARHGAALATGPPLALPPWSLVVSRGPITRAAQLRDVPRDTPSRGQANFLAAPCRRPPSGVKWSGVKWSQVETKSSGVKWSPSQVESSGVKHMSYCFGGALPTAQQSKPIFSRAGMSMRLRPSKMKAGFCIES